MKEGKLQPHKRGLAPYIAKRLNLDDIASSLPVLRVLAESKPLSQPEVAARLNLSVGTCNLHLQRLEHQGLLHRLSTVRGQRGRPTIIWDIDRRCNAFACLVFDAPYLHASLVDFDGELVDFLRCDLSGVSDLGPIVERVEGFLTRIKTLVSSPEHIRQVVVALPGTLDWEAGRVLQAANLSALNGFEPRTSVSKVLGVPCYVCNLTPPYYFGETETFPQDQLTAVLFWDLGLGMSLGRGRSLVSFRSTAGPFNHAPLADIGHLRIRLNGRKCLCGRYGCLEAYVGGRALLKELEPQRLRTLDDLIEASTRGDRRVVELCQRAARLLGETMAWPIQALGVQRVLVSGLLAPVFERVSKDFCAGLGSRLTAEEIKRLNPTASAAPQQRMLRGAYLLAKQVFLYSEDLFLSSATPGARIHQRESRV